jgi:hypothetical protein
MTQQLEPEPRADPAARMGVAQIVNAHTVETSAFSHRLPQPLEIGARLVLVGSGCLAGDDSPRRGNLARIASAGALSNLSGRNTFHWALGLSNAAEFEQRGGVRNYAARRALIRLRSVSLGSLSRAKKLATVCVSAVIAR